MTHSKKLSRGRTPDGSPNPIDIHIGSRIKKQRRNCGLTQKELSNCIGITFQQLQKYEKAESRISASRMWYISRALNVPIDFFYEDMNENLVEESLALYPQCPKVYTGSNANKIDAETSELITAFCRIRRKAIAQQLLNLIKSIAGQE